jgi:hypothetical protein
MGRRALLFALVAPLLFVFAAVSPRPAIADPARAAAPAELTGDANCDGLVNGGDAISLLAASALDDASSCDPYTPDANCDGAQDLRDVFSLLSHLAELSSSASCTPGQPLILGDSAASLIDEAQANHSIDADTALIYKTFAFYGDDRLPQEYRGDPRLEMPESALNEAHNALSSMPAEKQALLAPYFIPPAYVGSWTDRIDGTGSNAGPAAAPPEELKLDWSSVAGEHIRVWYSTDDWPDCSYGGCTPLWGKGMADLIVAQEQHVWGDLTTLMGRSPLSDEQLPYGGGDGKLDIFLVVMGGGTFGRTTTISGGCQHKSAYIEINQQKSPAEILSAFAHELMHAVQFAFSPANCADMDWWSEATANFAIEYVYHDFNVEHRWSRQYLFTSERPIEEEEGLYQFGSGLAETPTRAYGTYVFPWFIQFDQGDPEMVRRSWENSESQGDSLKAINGALSGGFKERWPDFAVQNWNANGEPMVNDFSHDYGRYDRLVEGNWLQHHDEPDQRVEMNGMTRQTYKITQDVPHLSQIYRWYEFKDENVKQVGFFNEFPSDSDGNVRLQAMVKIAGQDWKLEDWSKDDFHSFCRTRSEENIEELVIVVSNATYDDRDDVAEAKDTRLTARSAPCSFYGSAKFKYTVSVPGGVSSTITNTAEVYWDVQGDEEGETRGKVGCVYLVDDCFLYYPQADVNWTYSYSFKVGSASDCTDSNSGSNHVDEGSGSYMVLQSDGSGNYTYDGTVADATDIVTGACEPYIPVDPFNAPQTQHFKTSANNNEIKGTYVVPTFGGSYTWTWNFRR